MKIIIYANELAYPYLGFYRVSRGSFNVFPRYGEEFLMTIRNDNLLGFTRTCYPYREEFGTTVKTLG